MENIDKSLSLDSIAGYEAEKAEAIKIINLFKNYDKLKEMGVSLPKGLILSGEPGVGKTLMAKVISSVANVPFFQYEASEDDEPSKCINSLKKLYKDARKVTPSIVFIDELDEILPSDMFRSDTTNTVLKNLLVELDGINSNDGVLTIATTNNYYDLPDPLIRSGRLDKHIDFTLPDFQSRKEILKLYSKDNELLSKLNIDRVARATKGLSCADLKTLLNETLIQAVSDNKEEISTKDCERIIPLISFKGIRKKTNKEPNDRVCYHELGHFIVHYVLNGTPTEVSVEQIGDVKGYSKRVFYSERLEEIESEEENILTKTEYENRAAEILGGYASELIFTGETSNGVSDDIKKFGVLIQSMANLGMLGVDFMYLPDSGFVKFQGMLGKKDTQVERDPRKEYFNVYLDKAKEIINNNKDLINYLFNELKVKRTLDSEEIMKLIDKYNKTK